MQIIQNSAFQHNWFPIISISFHFNFTSFCNAKFIYMNLILLLLRFSKGIKGETGADQHGAAGVLQERDGRFMFTLLNGKCRFWDGTMSGASNAIL